VLNRLLTTMGSHPVEAQNVIDSDDPTRIVFYTAKLGVALHSVRSVSQYAQRYRVVQAAELARGNPWPPPDGPKVPDIPLHVDRNWERSPGDGLFDIDLESLKGPRSKRLWLERRLAAASAANKAEALDQEMQTFVLASLFGQVVLREGVFVVADPAKDRPLHKFRDRAFEEFSRLHGDVKSWVVEESTRALKLLVEDRRTAELTRLLKGCCERLEVERRGTDTPEEKEHLRRELDALKAIAGANRINLE
jgi:hypothetical protein